MSEPTEICILVKNSEYCTEQMKPPKRDYFECLCSSMLEVTVNIPVEKQYASRSNHIWGHKRHIYFRNGTLTITLDEIAMQQVNSEFSIALHTHLNLILSEIKISQCRSKILPGWSKLLPSVCWQSATLSPPSPSSTPRSSFSASLPPHIMGL